MVIRGRPEGNSVTSIRTSYGYIASPRFPDLYPAGVQLNITLLNALPSGIVRIDFTDFTIHMMSSFKVRPHFGPSKARCEESGLMAGVRQRRAGGGGSAVGRGLGRGAGGSAAAVGVHGALRHPRLPGQPLQPPHRLPGPLRLPQAAQPQTHHRRHLRRPPGLPRFAQPGARGFAKGQLQGRKAAPSQFPPPGSIPTPTWTAFGSYTNPDSPTPSTTSSMSR